MITRREAGEEAAREISVGEGARTDKVIGLEVDSG